MCKIRLLNPNEIDVRIQSINQDKKFAILLLYKDARCDMRILDETFGVLGWQRGHELINGNLFCTVEIFNKESNSWIRKQDVGTESNTEKEKGEASDSFKRACVNIGIGRELYSAPSILVNINEGENIKYTKFKVSDIQYDENREIISLKIIDSNNSIRFSYPKNEKSSHNPALLAKKEMSEVKTIEEATAVWKKYPSLQNDEHFKREKERAKARLTV